MAHEYVFPFPRDVSESITEVILQMPSLRTVVEIHSNAGNEVKLRWCNTSLRSEWPEDATISWDARELLLSIHSGTGDQRGLLTECLSEALSDFAGKRIEFHEV